MEQRLDIESQAAATILERGARIPFRAPLFLRLFGKKEVIIKMKPAPLGRLIEISRVFTDMGVEVEKIDSMSTLELNDFIVQHTSSIVKMVGIMLFGKTLFLPAICKWLLNTMTSRKLADMVKVIIAINGVESFMISIVLMGQMRMTQPKMKTSPMENRSQEVDLLA